MAQPSPQLAAIANTPYPNRLQLKLQGSLSGPLTSDLLGPFDPRRDIQIYNNGKLMTVNSYTWDGANNRYLIFLSAPLTLPGDVQIVHHVPDPPFHVDSNPTLFDSSLGTEPDVLPGT